MPALPHDAAPLSLCEPPGALRHPVGAQLQEFIRAFCGRHIVTWALCRSYGGGLKRSRLRTVYWRLTMGYFPTDTLPPPEPPKCCPHPADPVALEHNVPLVESWIPHVVAQRERYRSLQRRVLAPPSSGDAADEDATHNNPLQQGNPEWREYFQRINWSKVVEKDLARLDLSDNLDTFFSLPELQTSMRAVIMTWAAANADVGYKQGMHELAAVLLLLVVRDSRRRSLEEARLPPLAATDMDPEARLRRALNVFLDFQEYEADCFTLLDLLLNRFRLREWYIQGEHTAETSAAERCLHIQNSLVSKVEPMLAEHLVHLGVEPQVYALRWLRLLFLREFVLEDCFVLWDAIFAHGYATGEGCDLARWIMVEMLRYVKTDLLEADYAFCIRRLMRFPPAPDIHLFVAQGLEVACSEIGLKFLMAFQQDELLARQEQEYQEQCTSPVDPPGDAAFEGCGPSDTPASSDQVDHRGTPKGPPQRSLFDSDSEEDDAEAHVRRQMALLLASKETAAAAPPPPTEGGPQRPASPTTTLQACPLSENPLIDEDPLSTD